VIFGNWFCESEFNKRVADTFVCVDAFVYQNVVNYFKNKSISLEDDDDDDDEGNKLRGKSNHVLALVASDHQLLPFVLPFCKWALFKWYALFLFDCDAKKVILKTWESPRGILLVQLI